MPSRSDSPPEWPLPDWVAWAGRHEIAVVTVEVSYARAPRPPRPLSGPLGSIVRGLLGERLRDLRCLTRAPSCEGCGERARCDFATLFDPQAAGLEGLGDAQGVQLYWIQGVRATTAAPSDETVVARLCLAGPAIAALPYFEVAFRDALAALAQHARREGAGPPRLAASRVDRLRIAPTRRDAQGTTVQLAARTPLILRGDEAACREMCPHAPWLPLLLRAGVRRLARLTEFLDPSVPAPHAAFPRLDRVEVLAGGLVPWRGSRFSHRQERRMWFEGFEGSAVIRGSAVADLAPLLLALGQTSIGKQTTMGFGDLGVQLVA